jgi:TIR domain/AAA-like domain
LIDLFISHNKAEKEWARELAAELKKRGITYFLDEESIRLGDDVVETIGTGLKASRHIALIISPASVRSRWVELEWASALYDDLDASKRKLLPILKRTCEIPYMLKRLNYLDARDLDVVAVAEKLVAEIQPSGESDTGKVRRRSKSLHRRLGSAAPLTPYSKSYVRRDVDDRIKQIIVEGRSAIVYGPRQIGKTSLLNQMAADLTLIDRTCVFVDATALLRSKDGEAIWAYIAHRIADALYVHFGLDSALPVALQVHRLINSVSASTPLVLFLDEADVLASSHDPITMGILRSLVNDPNVRGRLSIVCAGLQPQLYFEPNPAFSPWWNPFELVRLQAFSQLEIRKFAKQVGLRLTRTESQTAHALTAGHPRMVGTLLKAIDRGHSLPEISRDPLSPTLELAVHAFHTYKAAEKMLGPTFLSAVKALMSRRKISSQETRELLWLAGITHDLDDNPPICSDVFLRFCRGKRDRV